MILGVYDILAWLIIGSLVGALCGKYKGRVAEGIAAGMVLGPLGWLLMLLAKDMRARCPECGGLVVQGVRRCQHCTRLLPGALPDGMRIVKCPACGEQGSGMRRTGMI